mmetsp:Transcript_23397/g.39697  ORF Transcript_23397/g.39697 Transcript_23397/m.39697 type:complete len:731 (+) Transcript_23397:74-2266(+)
MSSKHIRALGAHHSLVVSDELSRSDSEGDDEDDDDKEGTNSRGKSTFLALDDESDDDSTSSMSSCCSKSSASDDDNSDNDISSDQGVGFHKLSTTKVKSPSPRVAKSSPRSTNDATTSQEQDDDMQFLDSFLQDNALSSTSGEASTGINQFSFLTCDRHALDIDAVMRRRFGGSSLQANNDEEAVDNNPNNRKNKNKNNRNRRIMANQMKKSAMLSKRLLFGAPKDDWPKPLSFINGGFCMKRVCDEKSSGKRDDTLKCGSFVNKFEIQWSTEYHQLQEEYIRVQSSGDANQLCFFISRHPHHLDALLQLAMVFARTGQMDRATDLIRRCLYYLEQVHIDSFKPYEYPCLMDISQQENKIYFLSLFRHMQISGMMGCPKVASSIAKYILSLDPVNDPLHVLLFLDHYYLSSGNYSELNSFCSENAARVLLMKYSSTLRSEKEMNSIDGDDKEAMDKKACVRADPPSQINEVLPNWAFSVSLCQFLQDSARGSRHLKPKSANVLSPSVTTLSQAQILFINACQRFPFMVSASLSAAMSEDKARRSWKSILEHPFFEAFSSADRLAAHVGSTNSNALFFLSRLHKIKAIDCGNSSLWKREDVLGWIYDTLQCFIESMSDEHAVQQAIADSVLSLTRLCSWGAQPPATTSSLEQEATQATRSELLHRYMSANEEDFLDEYPRLPPDANPLDPRFTDPRVLAGEVVPNMGGNVFGFGGGNGMDAALWELQGTLM